ncbi:MerR family transcriptional regulator [Paenibacillus ehimensis]|uniref:Methyltransferase domain-containing protein n=1 Tax=Paenibacillus ehimensis TaxID=79264 RepID=A0ABT8V6B2_9BACL|nr:methyltransferase domain-containing protein [Paenibacillus ehimensis]MDO3676961.1 methyltransferase domain-containing protein [Paenibacillus ehimensis]
MKSGDYATTGQIAKRTGITLRTLRYYDQIGLLSPSQHSQASVRLYSKEDLVRLQKIQTLKYIGLTLQEIKEVIREESLSGHDLRSSLTAQKETLRQKLAHMEVVVKAINQAMGILKNEPQDVEWSSLIELIHAVHSEKDWVEQYHTATRLQTRIQLYDKCSVNPTGWHRWLFGHLIEQTGCTVLEVGCGDGALWARNMDRVPEAWRVTLSDFSHGMLEEARSSLGERKAQFKFVLADVQDIPFHDEQFDIVIANNMLYHVPDIPKALSEIHRVLKPGGCLFASTMSKRHLQEVEQLAAAFDPEIRVLDPVIERFNLDNGEQLLSPWFSEVRLYSYDDHLIVSEVRPLLEYITSTPMNARQRLTGAALHHFERFLNSMIEREGKIRISKDSGFFLGRKRSI